VSNLVLHAAEILGQVEEYRGRGQRELVHPVTRLRFTFSARTCHRPAVLVRRPVARMAATMAFRFAHAVEQETGLSAYDPQLRDAGAEMGLEKFIAGYLAGRVQALGQDAGGAGARRARPAPGSELAAAGAAARPGPVCAKAIGVRRSSRPGSCAGVPSGQGPLRGETGRSAPERRS